MATKGKPNYSVKIFSLGGLGVVGMNMYVVECGNEIIVMDAGVLFAGGDQHGVSYIIPDFKYLKENERKIVTEQKERHGGFAFNKPWHDLICSAYHCRRH